MITPSNVGNFSLDALILAARLAQEPWLSAETAATLDADLEQIRARFPQLQEVHAWPDNPMTELSITLDLDAPWLETWKSEQLTTGDAAVDGLLQEFGALTIRDYIGPRQYRSERFIQWLEEKRHYRYFYLTFAHPFNLRPLAERIQAASRYFHGVGGGGNAGDGDRITFEQIGASKRYTFSHGWGDCPSGCIHRHSWEVTLLPDGDLRLREYGDPLPPPPEVYAPAPTPPASSPAWAARTAMPTPRSGLAVAVASNGKLYAIGGAGSTADWPSSPPYPEWAVATVEEYDPATDAWTRRRDMAHPRAYAVAVEAGNGRIYVIGGRSSRGTSAAVEEYDPATDTWATRAAMPTPRTYPGVAAAANGKIYLFGGVDRPDALTAVDEYDPASDTWATREDMPYVFQPGLGAAASNGKVYAIGLGSDAQRNSVGATAEYDPATDTWTPRTGLPSSRMYFGVAAAGNGKVYAIGGVGRTPDGSVLLGTVEEYDRAADP